MSESKIDMCLWFVRAVCTLGVEAKLPLGLFEAASKCDWCAALGPAAPTRVLCTHERSCFWLCGLEL